MVARSREDIAEMCRLRELGLTYRSIGEQFGISAVGAFKHTQHIKPRRIGMSKSEYERREFLRVSRPSSPGEKEP